MMKILGSGIVEGDEDMGCASTSVAFRRFPIYNLRIDVVDSLRYLYSIRRSLASKLLFGRISGS